MTSFDDGVVERLRLVLAAQPAVEITAPQHRRACVLIPLIRAEDGRWNVLLSRRADNLAAHSGQIAFPGGSAEEGETLEAAAVRETEEEVGIPRNIVELIGRLDDVVTHSGFLVAPFVGIVSSRVEYVLQQSEVVEVFEVPLDVLLASGNPQVRYVTFRDKGYPAYYYHHEDYEIWGLTGRMLKAFLDVVWMAM